MTARPNRDWVAQLAWNEVGKRIAAGAVAILPIGAGSKEHGFHLPMNTDEVQARYLSDAVAARIDALIWPTLTYGYYPAFVNYAGSISLSETAFEQVIHDVLTSLGRHGLRRILVLDTGISTIAPVARVVARFSESVLHLKVHSGPRCRARAQELVQQSHGSHADELETSLMLAMASELVDLSLAQASPRDRPAESGPLTSTDAASPNYSRSGSYGDPTLATHAKGEILLAAMIDDIVEAAEEFVTAERSENGPVEKMRAVR